MKKSNRRGKKKSKALKNLIQSKLKYSNKENFNTDNKIKTQNRSFCNKENSFVKVMFPNRKKNKDIM